MLLDNGEHRIEACKNCGRSAAKDMIKEGPRVLSLGRRSAIYATSDTSLIYVVRCGRNQAGETDEGCGAQGAEASTMGVAVEKWNGSPIADRIRKAAERLVSKYDIQEGAGMGHIFDAENDVADLIEEAFSETCTVHQYATRVPKKKSIKKGKKNAKRKPARNRKHANGKGRKAGKRIR